MSDDATTPAAPVKLAPLDLVSWWMDSPQRPLDFTTIHRFTTAPSPAAFSAGAESARRAFPVSACRLSAGDAAWAEPEAPDPDAFRCIETANDEALRGFVDAPWDLRRSLPVRQLVLRRDQGAAREVTVATRFHHAACDGVSAMLWLSHAFGVTFGEISPCAAPSRSTPLPLRHLARAVRKSAFAPWGAAPRLRRGSPDSPRATDNERPRRAWYTLTLPRTTRGHGDEDLLAAAFLASLCAWDGRKQPFGLWMPVNIRRRPHQGFGNGTSRIRVYATKTWHESASFEDEVAALRRQRRWSLRHGEWSVPPSGLLRAPQAFARPLLRAYLNRPWVDMGSAAFTRLRDGPPSRWTTALREEESVGLLHRRHPLSLIVVERAETRSCTFTFDPSWLGRSDVETIAAGFRERIAAVPMGRGAGRE